MLSKKTLAVFVAAITLISSAILWTSCNKNGGDSSGVKTAQVGVILPLTGGAASLGKASLNGMQLAVENYNAGTVAGEPKVELITEDDQANPANGISAFQKLIDINKVRLILGPLPSGVTLAVAPLAERNHVVILSPGSSAPALTQAGDYIFRNELSEEYGARQQADLAYSRLNYKTIALLYVNNEYGAGTVEVFRNRFNQLGGRIVAEEAFNSGTTDFRTALTKIKAANPDAIFVVFQDDITNIVKQRSELGLSQPIFTTPVFEDPANLQKLGTLAEGIIYTYYGSFDPEAQSGVMADFATKYKGRFGEAPTYYSALGYDAAQILITALRASKFEVEKVKDNLYQIRNFQGVTGETSFDANGDVSKPVSLKIVRGGRFVTY